jgi:hypothetical protein
MSGDFITGFKVPGIDDYRKIPQPWSRSPVPGSFVKAPALYGGPEESFYTSSLIDAIKPPAAMPTLGPASTDFIDVPMTESVSGPDPDNTELMDAFSSPDPDTGGMPYVPPVNPLAMIYDVVALGLNLFGGMQKSDAERKAGIEKQRYYDDLATYEERTSRIQAVQISQKMTDLSTQARAIAGEQAVMAAAAGYSGQSLEDLKISDALAFRIDKAMIKEASRQAIKSGYGKASRLRKAGEIARETSEREADLTMVGTIAQIGGQLLMKGAK